MNIGCESEFSAAAPVLLQYSHDAGRTWALVKEGCYPGSPGSGVCEGSGRELREPTVYNTGDYEQWNRVTVVIPRHVAARWERRRDSAEISRTIPLCFFSHTWASFVDCLLVKPGSAGSRRAVCTGTRRPSPWTASTSRSLVQTTAADTVTAFLECVFVTWDTQVIYQPISESNRLFPDKKALHVKEGKNIKNFR